MSSIYWISTSSTDWNTAANWSGSAVPVNGDDVFIANSAVDIAAYDASAVTLATLNIADTYTGKIGSANTYLKINGTTLNNLSKSGRIRIDGTWTTWNVFDGASSASDTGYKPIMAKGTITTMHVRGGVVGVALATPVEISTVTTINVIRSDQATTAPVVTLAPGVTTTTINFNGGTMVNRSNNSTTTILVTGGDYQHEGNGAITTMKCEGGSSIINGTGTISNFSCYDAVADLRNETRAKTISNADIFKGARFYANSNVTFSNGVDVNGCDLDDVTLQVGNDRRLSLGAAA